MKVKADWAKRAWKDAISNSDNIASDIHTSIRDIESQLINPTEIELGTYIVDCGFLSVNTSRCAIVKFNNKETADAWLLLAESFVYALTGFKIAFAIKIPNGTPRDLNRGSLLFCSALALKCRPVAEWTARFILDVEANPKSKLRPQEPDDFQCLAYLFAAEVTGSTIKRQWREQLDAGLYGPLLRAETLAEAQAALPELAIARGALVLESFMAYPPFEWPPYDLFPIDILAILLMRHTDMAEFDFGCLESPLCHPPAVLNWEKNDLIRRVEARVQSLYEYSHVDWE